MTSPGIPKNKPNKSNPSVPQSPGGKKREAKISEAKAAIIGSAYDRLKELVVKYAEGDLPVLFVGETGSGKELLADLYKAVNTRNGEKMTVNCAGFPETLLWSEIFGHIRGAFTDAINARDGLIKTCHNGILFLDELGEAPSQLQAAILRVSERNSYKALGSDREETSVDTLIIGATNNPSNIREDLKQRFQILPVPPLQKQDIPVLAAHFLKRPIIKEVLEMLMGKTYEGNIRDLGKTCRALKVERGNSIFADKKNIVESGGFFDYECFRRDFLTWQRHIQPILDKYKLNFKYRYLPKSYRTSRGIFLTRGWVDSQVSDKSKVTDPATAPENGSVKWDIKMSSPDDLDRQMPSMIDLIKCLKIGKEEVSKDEHFKPGSSFYEIFSEGSFSPPSIKLLPKFISNLEGQFEEGELPYLLERLSLEDEKPVREGAISKPDLTPLLELPPDEAEKQFKNYYYNFHLQKHSGNVQETADALNMPTETLESKIKRLKKSKQKS